MKNYFESLKSHVLGNLRSGESVFLNFMAESSQFVRINGAKVRQLGTVDEVLFQVTLLLGSQEGSLKKGTYRVHLAKNLKVDLDEVDSVLKNLRMEVEQLPIDPFAKLPENTGSSEQNKTGALIPQEEVAGRLLGDLKGTDIAGIYAAGSIYRGMANSAGQNHWFSTENFVFDYSLYTQNKRAVKGYYAGSEWSADDYHQSVASSRQKLSLLEKRALKLSRGQYRTYLAPAAYGDLIQILSWGCISEAAIRQGDSPLRALRSGERGFSPLFTLVEDFSEGQVPRFNSDGMLAPEQMALIQDGMLVNTWISSRSAKEYGVNANGAESDERLRSPSLRPGSLQESMILEKLGTGLYLSNLHYLNWSDQPGGRVTGMTRYACFWVENGQFVAPIEDLRFDDTLFHLMGDYLEDLTASTEFLPETSTYGMRSLGGMRTPGALLSAMEFTL